MVTTNSGVIFLRGFEMAKLTHYDRHNITVLHQHTFLWQLRTFHSAECDAAGDANRLKLLLVLKLPK